MDLPPYKPYLGFFSRCCSHPIISSTHPLSFPPSGTFRRHPAILWRPRRPSGVTLQQLFSTLLLISLIILRYGPVWISTTLIFMLGALGNCATYLMQKKTGASAIWNFDINYFNWAAFVVYAYVVAVPAAFYFLFQYFAVSSSLVRVWCMWGYSLCIFIPCSFILIIPVEMLRWFVIILAGASSGSFIAMNLKTYTEEKDLMMLVVTAFLLQFALAIFIKIFFFV